MELPDSLAWLQSYLAENCDGDWEHEYGVSITSTDNPGWHVRIDLTGTKFEELVFAGTKKNRTADNWIIIGQSEGVLFGSGGPNNLAEIIERLREILK